MNRLVVRFLPYALAFFSSLCIMSLELVAARLVARHVGSSLPVWISVIGIILAGICLGNFLGGRLADRTEPRRAIGPLFAMGTALTIGVLWMNSVVGLTPGLDLMPWGLRTVVVVSLDFLIPATALGMIGPVVAKVAVEQAKRAGSAIGDVYFWGAVGSIVGTFLTGFILIYLAATSTIVTVIAAAFALVAAGLLDSKAGLALGLLAGACLGIGSINAVDQAMPVGLMLGTISVNPLLLVGHALALGLAIVGFNRLRAAWLPSELLPPPLPADQRSRVRLADLAALSFLISLAFMATEMVAGRMVTRHLGSSIYGWTSVIGVLLGGLSLGNLIGGKVADFIKSEKQASWLFLIASVLLMGILVMETPPSFLHGILGDEGPVLSRAITMSGLSWPVRVLTVVTVVFFLPSIGMGTVSPVLAKLAVDRLRRDKRTGTAIGEVYAWGMVGSILGTFLAGFFLISLLGTKGLILVLATALALVATMLGSVWHAVWAGIPLGLCVIAFIPTPWFEEQGLAWGVREPSGDPDIEEYGLAHVEESNYYFIKVSNDVDFQGNHKRTLVLDNLIHGYFMLGHPEHLEYDYEFIYAQVARRVAEAKAKQLGLKNAHDVPLRTFFLGGGAYTFPRYLEHIYSDVHCDVAEIDPAVTEANHIAMGLPRDTPIQTHIGDARQFVETHQNGEQYDLIFGDAFNDFSVPWHLTTREFNEKIANLLTPEGAYLINIIDVYKSDERAEVLAERELRNQTDSAIDSEQLSRAKAEAIAEARRLGGFLSAWVNTAQQTFPYVSVFGTDEEPGYGLRETFVVVASKVPIDLEALGRRENDPMFFQGGSKFEPDPYDESHMDALAIRSRGIILTDDYAPVENLLAPVAATRGEE